jgi:hypothetical protein
LIWIEGKRDDWLSPSTKWDVTRDQLARNVDAAWCIASKKQDDRVLICHEYPLEHHEVSLLEGYRRRHMVRWLASPFTKTATEIFNPRGHSYLD